MRHRPIKSCTAIRAKRGSTLAELMVGMAIGSIALLLVAQFLAGDSKKRSDVRSVENMQSFEIANRKALAGDGAVDQLVALTSDPQLKICMLSPCAMGCSTLQNWRPTEWINVPAGMRVIGGALLATGGSYSLPDWKLCTSTGGDFDLNCPGRARAEWRSGPGRTIDLRLIIEVPTAKIRRVVHRLLPLPDPDGDPRCSKHRGVYCKDNASYLIKADFLKNENVCAGTDVEENYR